MRNIDLWTFRIVGNELRSAKNTNDRENKFVANPAVPATVYGLRVSRRIR